MFNFFYSQQKKQNTSSKYIVYICLTIILFRSLLKKDLSQQLSCFVKRNHISIWKWIQHYKPMKISQKRQKVLEFITIDDETLLKIGNQNMLGFGWHLNQQTQSDSWYSYFLWENNSCCWKVPQRFDKEIWKTSAFNRYGGTWYSQACRFVKIKHHLHSSYEKSIIERTIQYIKDRTECFDDDYFPCKKEKCKLQHISNWFNLFVDYHNKEVMTA